MTGQRQVVEIVAIGNELLIGDVLDTNTHWLCQQITGLGGVVRRAALVRDDLQAVGQEVLGALARRSGVVFTTGGLGPTDDDMTLRALAQALGRPLALDGEALAQIESRYYQLWEAGLVAEAALTPERRKMAVLPRGAQPLANPVGGAPGVLLEQEGSAIVCLPGVPEELKAIFQQTLPPLLQAWLGGACYREEVVRVDCRDESALAPVVDAVAARHPRVYVKSRAKAYGAAAYLQVTLSARGPGLADVQQALQAARADLEDRLREAGFPPLDLGQDALGRRP
ncbi:MAG: competence/damage-inducible protein A [Chloroflexi bacterium]|nr:competence/damage-inducible protein A [Chloroflexota bacterium]